MKSQILFSGKSKKNITNLPSAELTKRMIKVQVPSKICRDHILTFFFFFFYISEKISLDILCELSV